MNVLDHIRQNGISSLVGIPLYIDVKEYDSGLVVLNYNQIDSPKHNEVVKECRGLILDSKNNWKIVSRSFDRFFNFKECPQYDEEKYPMSKCIVWEKVDGSLINIYCHNGIWNAATRKMAYAEGPTKLYNTFRLVFDQAYPDLQNKLKGIDSDLTLICEMVSPETRVVTHYPEPKLYLLSARNGDTGKEVTLDQLKELSKVLNIDLPKMYTMDSIDDILKNSKELPALEEGYVCSWYNEDGSVYRLKIKNPSYVAIAHIRDNGNLSLKRLALLVISGDEEEYLTYFPEDRYLFEPYIKAFKKLKTDVDNNWFCFHDEENRKRFALAIKDVPAQHILFAMKYKGKTFEQAIGDMPDNVKLDLLNKYKEI